MLHYAENSVHTHKLRRSQGRRCKGKSFPIPREASNRCVISLPRVGKDQVVGGQAYRAVRQEYSFAPKRRITKNRQDSNTGEHDKGDIALVVRFEIARC